MTGQELFQTSLKNVRDNLNEALAISAVIWLVMRMAETYLLGEYYFETSLSAQELVSTPQAVQGVFLQQLIALIGTGFISVAWNKYAILGQRPQSAIPQLDVKAAARYIGLLIAISILMLMAASVISSVMSMFLAAFPPLLIVGITLIGFGIMVGFYRFSPALVSVVLEKRVRLMDAFSATAGLNGAIMQLCVYNMIAVAALFVPSMFLEAGILAMLYWTVVGWIILIVGLSQMSQIYLTTYRT